MALRNSRVFAVGLGDQNMIVEDVAVEVETSRGRSAVSRGLAAHAAMSVLTTLLRVAWRTVAAIVTRVVADGRDTTDLLDEITRIGIDEITYRKGHTGISR